MSIKKTSITKIEFSKKQKRLSKDDLTDEKIESLLIIKKKRIPSQNTDKGERTSFEQMKYSLKDENNNLYTFYTRKSKVPGRENNFSCGLSIILEGEKNFTLTRYNGSSHTHKNPDSNQSLDKICHIHKAKKSCWEKYDKEDKYAEATEKYKTFGEAVDCILRDCNIQINDGLTLF